MYGMVSVGVCVCVWRGETGSAGALDSAGSHAGALLHRHVRNCAENHLAVLVEVQQPQGAHAARRAARLRRRGQRRHQRMVAGRLLVDQALAVAVERLVDVRRDHPVPAERAEVDAQRIPAAVLLLAVGVTVVAARVALAAAVLRRQARAQLDVGTLWGQE